MTSKKLVVVPPAVSSGGSVTSWRYHVYTKRDGRLYFNRLEIDKGSASLVGVKFTVYYYDERSGKGPATEAIASGSFPVDDALFRTVARVKWENLIDLPQAKVLRVAAKLELRGGETGLLYAYPVGTDSLQVVPEEEGTEPPVRTMGHRQYQLSIRGIHPLGPGATSFCMEHAFAEVKPTEPQTFFRAYAEVQDHFARGAAVCVDIPGTVSLFEPAEFQGEAAIHLPEGGITEPLTVRVTADAEVSATVAGGNATAIAEALNDDPLFGGYFEATADGDDINLTPLQNYLGTVSVSGASGVSAEGFVVGESGALNIQIGRKYTVQAIGEGGTSPLSPYSYTTGPCPAASKIIIHGIPDAGGGVTNLNILAAPDGKDGPFQVVTTASPGAASANDATPAFAGGEGEDPEGACPDRDGPMFLQVKKRGADWFEVTIEKNKQRSDIIPAGELGRMEENTLITVDVRYTLEEAPTLDKPGRPNDVRLVFE